MQSVLCALVSTTPAGRSCPLKQGHFSRRFFYRSTISSLRRNSTTWLVPVRDAATAPQFSGARRAVCCSAAFQHSSRFSPSTSAALELNLRASSGFAGGEEGFLIRSCPRISDTRLLRSTTNVAAIQGDVTNMAAVASDKMVAHLNDKMAVDRSNWGQGRTVWGFRKRVSLLYVPGNLGQTYTSLLIPFMDFDSKFEDLPKFVSELQLRGVAAQFGDLEGLQSLQQHWREFCAVKEKIESMEEVELKCRASMQEVAAETEDAELKKCVAELKKLKTRLNELESTVVPALLDLPNCVTPCQPGQVIVSRHPSPSFDFTPQPHTRLRASTSSTSSTTDSIELSGVCPGAFYLSGDVAESEMLLDSWWARMLDDHGYLRQCNPDFAKGVVVEGCGYHLQEKLAIVGHPGKDKSPLYLVGGASLPAYLGYFTKRAVKKPEKFLPQKLYSCQRMYFPFPNARVDCSIDASCSGAGSTESVNSSGHEDVFSSMQSTCVSLLVVGTKDAPNEEEIVKEVMDVVTKGYEKLGLHFRIVRSSYDGLRRYEKDALCVQMLRVQPMLQNAEHSSPNTAPSTEGLEYVDVGRISVIGDYISKRLLMMHVQSAEKHAMRKKEEEKHAFLHVVHAEVMHVPRYVALAMEHVQDEQGVARVRQFLQTSTSAGQE